MAHRSRRDTQFSGGLLDAQMAASSLECFQRVERWQTGVQGIRFSLSILNGYYISSIAVQQSALILVSSVV
jgi:hypothetical protein